MPAAISSSFPAPLSICGAHNPHKIRYHSSASSFLNFSIRDFCVSKSVKHLSLKKSGDSGMLIRAVEEEATSITQEEESNAGEESVAEATREPALDFLTMFFQAEGTMLETAIPNVTKVLEEIEGISKLRVQVLEGIASIEFTKRTTVQATGAASTLVETIRSLGFQLQTLNLSIVDQEDEQWIKA